MQMNFRMASVITLALITSFTACKKDEVKNDSSSTEVTTHSDDQNRVSGDLDDVTNDANLALESDFGFSGKQMNVTSICGATAVADTMSNPRTITITYNGNNCQNTTLRTGTIVLSMPAGVRWKDAGAAITMTFQNLKIKRLSDNKSITLNGSHTLTNVSGGLMISLPNQGTIIHTLSSSNMSITFDDNSQRVWQVAKKRTFTYGNGINLAITGNHTEGNNTRIAEWGTNRFGHSFTTSITEPLRIRQDCNLRLVSGQIKHEGFATATATFGLDVNGAPTSCPGAGHYYFKLEWTGPGGNTHSNIFPY